MVRLNWRGLDFGNQTIIGESLVREADGGAVWRPRAAIEKKTNNKQTKKSSMCFRKVLYTKKLLIN